MSDEPDSTGLNNHIFVTNQRVDAAATGGTGGATVRVAARSRSSTTSSSEVCEKSR